MAYYGYSQCFVVEKEGLNSSQVWISAPSVDPTCLQEPSTSPWIVPNAQEMSISSILALESRLNPVLRE
jgi:hypothetical protein